SMASRPHHSERSVMHWSRLSFFYLMSYLGLGGLGLLVAPELAIRLLGSSESYPPVMLKFIGAFMVSLSIVIIQIVRYRVEVLYPSTLMVRVVLLGTVLWLYVESRDPLFLSIGGIVALGMLFTMTGLLMDRKAPAIGSGDRGRS